MSKKQKTKILYLITGLHTGGAEVLIRDMAERLNKDQFAITVVSILPLGNLGRKMKENGIRVISLEASSKFNPSIVFRLYKVLRDEQPDILHTHLFHADILGRIVGKLAGFRRIVSTIHNIDIGGKLRETLLSVTKSLVDKNIAVSGVVAKSAIEKGTTKKRDVVTIYNGVDVDNFPLQDKQEMRNELGIPEEKRVFVSVGSLTRQKGYGYLINAVANLDSDAVFIILGEGNQRRALEKQISKLNLEDKVLLKGRVDNVNDYLQAADFFIMPSLWEGFSVALLEAALAGKVIIATDVGGNADVIRDGETGYLCKPENFELLAERTKQVLGMSEDERRRIGHQARKRVEQKFSIEKMVQEHEELYSKMTSNE